MLLARPRPFFNDKQGTAAWRVVQGASCQYPFASSLDAAENACSNECQYLSIYGILWNGMGERKHVRDQHLPRRLANQLDGHAAAPLASSDCVT